MNIGEKIKNKTIILFFFLLLIAGVYFMVCRSNSVVLSSAEMKYVEGAKGLVETGRFERWDFIANQTVKPFVGDKIFLTQIALAYKIFGVSEFTTRLPSFFWGLVFFIVLFLFCKHILKNAEFSIIMLFFVIFSQHFITMFRIGVPKGMYLALLIVSLYIILLKPWAAKICGALLLIFCAASILFSSEIMIVSVSEIVKRMSELLKFIFEDFRISWLMYIPIVFYLIQEKWWQKKTETVIIILASVLLAVLPFVYEINANNIIILFLSLVSWTLAIISLKYFFISFKTYGLIIFIVAVSVMFSFPFVKPMPPITQAAVCDRMLEKNNKTALQELYQYLDDNKLDIVHFIYANKFYLKDYQFKYAMHSSRQNLKIKFVRKYIQNYESGYLVYQNYLQKSVSGKLHKSLLNNLEYHDDISQKTGYQVFSWNASQRENFLNEINSQDE